MIVDSFSERDTFEAGKKLGRRAVSGEIYLLDGDLGTGKASSTPVFRRKIKCRK